MRGHSNVTRPVRLSLVCADTSPLPRPALEYLVLQLNTMQNEVEFEFLPVSTADPFLSSLQPGAIVDYDEFCSKAPEFIRQVFKRVAREATTYELPAIEPQHILVISLATLSTHYYEIFDSENAYSAIFLGDWDTRMAPPSVLDSLLSLIMMEAIYLLVSTGSHEISHYPTRGCVGDFNATLDDVRYKVLQGFLCSECRKIVEGTVGPVTCDKWTKLLGKAWVGSVDDASSPASIVRKLGFNLFLTKGYAPSTQERLLQLLQDEGTKEVLKLIGAILLAAILFLLGLKKA